MRREDELVGQQAALVAMRYHPSAGLLAAAAAVVAQCLFFARWNARMQKRWCSGAIVQNVQRCRGVVEVQRSRGAEEQKLRHCKGLRAPLVLLAPCRSASDL
jgi:hypothetical protein